MVDDFSRGSGLGRQASELKGDMNRGGRGWQRKHVESQIAHGKNVLLPDQACPSKWP